MTQFDHIRQKVRTSARFTSMEGRFVINKW